LTSRVLSFVLGVENWCAIEENFSKSISDISLDGRLTFKLACRGPIGISEVHEQN